MVELAPGQGFSDRLQLGRQERIEDLADALAETLELLGVEQCALYVGNDSGLMHIAAASQTPTLGLFGPSSEVRYGPRGKSVAAVRTLESFEDLVLSPDFNHLSADTLMSGLSVDSVYQALAKLYTSVKNGSERSVS